MMQKASSLLLTFAEHDRRICFSIQLKDKQFLYLNPAFESFFNIKRESANLNDLIGFVSPEDRDYLVESYHELKPGEFKDGIELRFLLADQNEYYFRLSTYLQGPSRAEGTLTGYLEDITSAKKHERRLDDLSNRKDAILNILSHDLAGPLGAIKNYTYLLSRRDLAMKDELAAGMISAIEKISRRSTNLISQFVKNEFLESVGVDVSKVRVNLVEKVGSFMTDYYGVQDTSRLNFKFETNQEQIFAEIDDSKFMQVINNLISNSMKFTPDGGTITVTLEAKEETVLIIISDTGIGIPEEFQSRLFDKFTKARRPGLNGEEPVGLGMSIVKTIVEWHNGKIWFESVENQGTTFYIEIPGTK
jgi:two-component system sensor histidine kinase VicK